MEAIDEREALQQELAKAGKQQLTKRAYALFKEFYEAYRPFYMSAHENELFYQSRDWETVPKSKPGDPKPTTPVVQSTVDALKADRMEGYPEAVILPQRMADRNTAGEVGALVKHVLELGDHREHYLKQVHDSLICGWQVAETGWDLEAHGGLGEAYMRRVNPRCFMADPRCEDIQQGRACFKFGARNREWMRQHYPQQYPLMRADALEYVAKASEARGLGDEEILMIEYWYREYEDGEYRVHMALFGGGVLLEHSREHKPSGYYEHGQYPFTVQPLYPIAGSPLGFSIVDVIKNPVMHMNKLEQTIIKNALASSKTRLLVNRSAEFDEEALLDVRSEVVRSNRIDEGAVRWFQTGALPGYMLQLPQIYKQHIKEYSGVNDVSRGQSGQGVTAASAILALQEAALKRSRLAEHGDHIAFAKAVRQLLEVIREYYDDERAFLTIDGAGEMRETVFKKDKLKRKNAPMEFFVSTRIQRQSTFRTTYYNDLAMQLLQSRVATPAEALKLMTFEGKDELLSSVAKREAQAMSAMQRAGGENVAQAQEGGGGDEDFSAGISSAE